MTRAPDANVWKRDEPQTVALMKEYMVFHGATPDWLEATKTFTGDWKINHLRHFPGNNCQYMDLPKPCINAIKGVLPGGLGAAPGDERAVLLPFSEERNRELEKRIYRDADFVASKRVTDPEGVAAWYAEQEHRGLGMKAPQTAAGGAVAGVDKPELLRVTDGQQQPDITM